MSRAKREVGAACALLGLFSAEAVTIASALSRAARSDVDVAARKSAAAMAPDWRAPSIAGTLQVSASYLLGPLLYYSSVTFSIHSTTFPFDIDIAIASCVLS
jgi:hypothetical protein